jgi:hypothetical protein
MVSDGSCGHRPMIQRPSDMVSVVDRPIDELIVVCCARKSTVFLYVPHKKIPLRQTKIQLPAAHFFNRSLSDLKVSFVNKYQYLICRA